MPDDINDEYQGQTKGFRKVIYTIESKVHMVRSLNTNFGD